jgi:hypothetical protein
VAATLTSDQEALTFFSFPIEKQEDTATINPIDGTPDILIWGKATDGTIDGDREIVDPEWSAKAIQEWASSQANVRMSHDPKRPVGKGQEVHVTTDGHYVKSLICDPLAKHFIRNKVLNDYSVGISEPDFRYRDPKLDPQGKALRVITGRPDGRSRIAEISICDRGSNFNSSFQIVKSAGGFTGQMVGDEDEIAKAAPASLTKMARGGAGTWTEAPAADMSGFSLPDAGDITFTPADMAKLFKGKIIEQHYDDLALKAVTDAERAVYKRDIDTATRRRLRAEGKALPNLSYPIENAGDLDNAAHLARSGHGDVAAARRLIARRARELGVANPLDESDGATKSSSEEEAVAKALTALDAFAGAGSEQEAQAALGAVAAAVKEAGPEVTKDPGPEPEPKDRPVKKAKKQPKGKKKLPPWLNKPDDSGDSGDDGACKSVADHLWTASVTWSPDGPVNEVSCSKCHTTPAEAAGLSGTHDMSAAPVGELQETPPPMSAKASPTPQSASGAAEAPSMTPVPQHREPDGAIVEPFEKDAGLPAAGQGEKPTRLEVGMMKSSPEVAAILRFRAAGIDAELGRAHDLTCPAYHPEDVAKCHPFADFRSVLDEGYFQRKAVEAACGPSLDLAKSLHLAWQAAHVLRETDPGVLNDFRMEAHKAFRDANPGPGSAPTPGTISPGKYNRPLLTDGRSASSPGHDGPNSSPQVAATAPNAHSFDRPPLESGHQSPSPSFMKASFEYPTEQGRPVQLNYAVMEKERARHALMQMHEHLSRQFPEVCPMTLDAPAVQPESRGVPAVAGIGKSGSEGESPAQVTKSAAPSAPVAAVFKAPAEGDLVDDAVYKGFKKMRKKLGKKVLAGEMTVDEARSRMGRQFAQKTAELSPQEIAEGVRRGTLAVDPSLIPSPLAAALTPDLIKAAVREALHVESVPLEPAAIQSFDPSPAIEAAVTKAVAPLLEKIQQQDETYTTKLAEQQRVIDAIADQPDPSTAAFSGLAFNPVRKAARPAGVPAQAEIAERTQQMVIRHLQDKVNSSSDPFEREAYYGTLAKMRGFDGT